MLSGISRWAARQMSTTVPTYPFSKIATFVEPPAPPTDALRKGKGLMEHLRKALVAPEKRHMVDVLFSRRHPSRLPPGSVLTVHTQQAPFSFSGVLLAVRRRGPDTSFVLRNVVQKTGVEMQFFVNSPDVQRITVIQKAGSGGGKGGRRVRRAKLFYLRHQPDKMSAISAGIRS
ncbi:translation protein SH3-like domain-containing protein [Phellopilus nigrolimitatus]|nr:translation protein SH3-like domain-containing protein [Phellopilus nigrolimitatus]